MSGGLNWVSPFVNSGVSGLVTLYNFYFITRRNINLSHAKSVDHDKTLQSGSALFYTRQKRVKQY